MATGNVGRKSGVSSVAIAGVAFAVSGFLTVSATASDQIIDVERFSSKGALAAPKVVDCTLSNGDSAQCYEFKYSSLPDGVPTGPYCPETVEDTGGVWLWDGDQAGLYVLNKAFWSLMESLGYNFTDSDGKVHIEDPSKAGPPPSSPTTLKVNNCLERGVDESIETTMQIPLVPVKLDTPADLGTVAFVGLALDGVPMFGDAPSVLDTGNLPPLDHCGGHFDPSGYYHWHEVATDVATVFKTADIDVSCGLPQKTSGLFAYAYDGHPIFGSTDSDGAVPNDLDSCNGHTGPTDEYPDGVYHYHAATKAHNLPKCLVGATSKDSFSTNASFGAGSANSGHGPRGGRGPGGPGGGPPPPR